MQIHQLVHTLNYGDAISGEALTIKRLLNRAGIESRIYSVHTHEKLTAETTDYRLFAEHCRKSQGDGIGLILHYSIASPLNQLFVDADDVARALIFHNLTPVHWFRRYNARVTGDLERGLAELAGIAAKADTVLADSDFNRHELISLGCEPVEVLPLLLDTQSWSEPANPGIKAILRQHGGPNVLHVGRLAPNKCIEDIIKAFYFYHHKIEQKSRLWLIGTDIDTEIYSFELRRLVSELRLKECVSFVGAVSNGELRAFYEEADLYLCLSEHEGFCMPLLEAMFFDAPIIAYDAGAVAETLGEGGVLVSRKTPAELAELMQYISATPAVRSGLIERGRERVQSFSTAAFAANLERCLIEPLRTRSAELGSGPQQHAAAPGMAR